MTYASWIRPSPLKVTQVYGEGHWEIFEEARRKHNENMCLQTNELILKLDKLVNNMGSNSRESMREEFWQSDELVNLCPYCAKPFTFARRKHHCRTCGAILCDNCSKFLEYKDACRFVKPAKLYTKKFEDIEDRLREKSLEDKPKIRTCEDCRRLLDKRLQKIDDCYCRPSYLKFYEDFRKNIAEADELILSHHNLISQNKQPTPELKSKIQELKQSVAQSTELKKTIERFSGKQKYLLTAINQSVGYWLKESIEAKFRRIHGPRESGDILGSGFVPEQSFSSLEIKEEENPFLIQIKNLEEYIRQAKLADKYEEVSALEQSKRELEIEYFDSQLDFNISLETQQ